MSTDTGRAFVIRPFGIKQNADGELIDFEHVHNELISPALDKIGMSGGTTGKFLHQGVIHEDMFREIVSADVVIADISMHNANAFYELGIRHALRDRYTVMIRADKHNESHVFDLKPERYLNYFLDCPGDSIDALVEAILASVKNDIADSPVYRLLPNLPKIDPHNVVVVPTWFSEETTLAKDAETADSLLVLRNKSLRQHWEKEGLRLVGHALSDKGFHKEAVDVWEQIRSYSKLDRDANRMLATHYQKLDRITESEQAAERCLSLFGGKDWDLAEVHALIGSNYKMRWRNDFTDIDGLVDRQKRALTSDTLSQSYEAYHTGFECHRSHYYSGLNAVCMLRMQILLAEKHFEKWVYLYDSEEKAELEMKERVHHIKKLEAAAELAITTSVNRYNDDWARISRADLLLLTSFEPQRVASAYTRCASVIKDFKADSLLDQLKLYQSLGLFEENVDAVLAAIK